MSTGTLNPMTIIMSKKELVAPEATEEVKPEVAPEPVEGEGEAKEETTEPSQTIDYKAIAEAERERADKLQQTIAKHAFKERRGEKDEQDVEVDEEDKPLTRREAEEFFSKSQAQNQKILQETTALEIARRNSSSEEEAQAGFLMWKTRVTPTGNLEEDVKFALGGLNRDKLVSENKELRRTVVSKDTRNVNAGSTHRDEPEKESAKIPADEAAQLKREGFSWDGVKRMYVRPMKDGKNTFFYDPQTKKRGVL